MFSMHHRLAIGIARATQTQQLPKRKVFCCFFQRMQPLPGSALCLARVHSGHCVYLSRIHCCLQCASISAFCKGLHLSQKQFYHLTAQSRMILMSHQSRHVRKMSHMLLTRLKVSSALFILECHSETHARANFAAPQLINVANGKNLSIDDSELLQKAIAYEAERGFPNCTGKRKRFGEFLSSKLCALSSQDDKNLNFLFNSAQRYDVMSVDERINLLNKVCPLLGFNCIEDLVDHHIAVNEGSQGLQPETSVRTAVNNHDGENATGLASANNDSTLMHASLHPAIMLGDSERVELYKGTNDDKTSTRLSQDSLLYKGTYEGEGPDEDANVSRLLSQDSSVYKETPEEKLIMSVSCEDSPVDPLNDSDESQIYESAIQELHHLRNLKGGSPSSQMDTSSQSTDLEYRPDRQSKEHGRDHVGQTKRLTRSVKPITASDIYESWLLNKPISMVKSLSSYRRSQLDEHGLHTLRKLLQHYPRTYVNFLQAGHTVEDGQYVTFMGEILACRKYMTSSLGIIDIMVGSTKFEDSKSVNGVSTTEIGDPNTAKERVFVHVKKFFRGSRFANNWFLQKILENYPLGAHASVSGKVKAMDVKNHFEMKEYNIELVGGDSEKEVQSRKERVYPVYPTRLGLDGKIIELCIQKVLPDLPLDIDPIPEKFRLQNGLMELREAYIGIHCPPTLEVAEEARRRLVFDEFFYLQLGLLLQRQQSTARYLTEGNLNIATNQAELDTLGVEKWGPLTLKVLDHLPYRLTDSQVQAASEIIRDLQKPVPMHRLLQGDVGCGKTIVAFLALLEVIGAGFQGALMGPTEFLARQQYERLNKFLEQLDEQDRPPTALLTSSVPASKARAVRQGLESGEIKLVVGTHSLLSDRVKFSSLGLAIIDEQHRFGVEQRIRLQNKGTTLISGESLKDRILSGEDEYNTSSITSNRSIPHVLAMSATPIPRTLAYAVHGDMALSQITGLPPGRTPVKTYTFMGDKSGEDMAFQMVHEELAAGGRAFIVCPVIDESEELPNLKAATVEFEKLAKKFDGYSCGLVHGKLKPTEKEEAMDSFKTGRTQLLVSTTVIEVGIDIPEASMMLVMNAERYGMAQLHQLRGRVGRGKRKSTCVLLASSHCSLERMKILETCQDGFYLAEEDLRLRGPGDLLGKQQSGHLPEFALARLEKDGDLMIQARKTAEDLLTVYPGLDGLPRLKQELSFRRGPALLGV